MSLVIPLSEFMADPQRYVDEAQSGTVIMIADRNVTVAPVTGAVAWAASDDEDADMVSLREKQTGIRNTLFASTKGYVSERDGPRIKIAVDPPDSLIAGSATTSMSIGN
jgi:hypothetical protein